MAIAALGLSGCGHSSGSAAVERGCRDALDGHTAATVAHGRASVLAASRTEAKAWAALPAAQQHRAITACVAHGGAPRIGG